MPNLTLYIQPDVDTYVYTGTDREFPSELASNGSPLGPIPGDLGAKAYFIGSDLAKPALLKSYLPGNQSSHYYVRLPL